MVSVTNAHDNHTHSLNEDMLGYKRFYKTDVFDKIPRVAEWPCHILPSCAMHGTISVGLVLTGSRIITELTVQRLCGQIIFERV